MPKPPFVAKENVERFIRSYVHENKKLPTMAEIRNHFGGGSMNRYSEILKEMNISAPEKKSPLALDPLKPVSSWPESSRSSSKRWPGSSKSEQKTNETSD